MKWQEEKLKLLLWMSTDKNKKHLMNWKEKFERCSLLFLVICLHSVGHKNLCKMLGPM
jgi:hypothetical protein